MTGRSKRKKVGNEDYISEPEPEEAPEIQQKKQKKQTTQRPGRKKAQQKYDFSLEDKKKIEKAVLIYGNSYSTIANEYFNDYAPMVTRKDIQNYINNDPHLKSLTEEGWNIYVEN
jgi:hypothetical protein